MPKYEVVLKEIEVYVVRVEADSEESAIDKAWDEITDCEEHKFKYHNDSEAESKAYEID